MNEQQRIEYDLSRLEARYRQKHKELSDDRRRACGQLGVQELAELMANTRDCADVQALNAAIDKAIQAHDELLDSFQLVAYSTVE